MIIVHRWEEEEKRNHMAWLSFGAGPRTCIGMRFAQVEEKLILCRMLRRYTLVQCPQTEVTIIIYRNRNDRVISEAAEIDRQQCNCSRKCHHYSPAPKLVSFEKSLYCLMDLLRMICLFHILNV